MPDKIRPFSYGDWCEANCQRCTKLEEKFKRGEGAGPSSCEIESALSLADVSDGTVYGGDVCERAKNPH